MIFFITEPELPQQRHNVSLQKAVKALNQQLLLNPQILDSARSLLLLGVSWPTLNSTLPKGLPSAMQQVTYSKANFLSSHRV